MAYYRCGPTAIGSRTSWGPVSSPVDSKPFNRPLSGNYDRIFNAFEKTNAFQYVRNSFEEKEEERHTGHGDIVVNRKMSSSFERADCALAAQTPLLEDEEFYREKILYSQARQLFPLQEDLADWINKTIGITYLTGENFLDVLDNGAELCQLAAVIHDKAREALDRGLIVGPVPAIRGRCWQHAARRSFFSRDNTENFLTFCRELGVHENLLFESDDLVLHNQPRQVILCLLEVARLATKFNIEPPGLVALEREIALEERDSGLDSAMSNAAWQFRGISPSPKDKSTSEPSPSPDPNYSEVAVPDNADNESTKSDGQASTDSDVPLKPTNELDKRVQLVTRLMERGCSCSSGKCSKLLKVKKVGEGRYNIAGRNVFIRLLKGRHMMVRVGGGWDTLEHFLSRHEPCQVRLVTQGAGRRSHSHSLTISQSKSLSLADSLPSLDHEPSVAGTDSPIARTVSPVDSKASSTSGKVSPSIRSEGMSSRASSGKSSPRTSTPNPVKNRTGLTLPLRSESVDLNRHQSPAPRTRKQSAPSFSTPNTPPGSSVRTAFGQYINSVTSVALVNAPKKSRSMSFALRQDGKFCGTERVNQAKGRSVTAATTPTSPAPRTTRSQSLASTPVAAPKKPAMSNGYGKQTRSMSLVAPEARPLGGRGAALGGSGRHAAVTISGALTQAAIEDTIRRSLAATITDDHDTTKKPFLHIKAKYRSAPHREVPPR